VPLSIMSQLNNPVLVAAPLYIIMGETIFQTGIGRDLYDTLHKWFYRLPGGLAIASVFACAIFGAMCGVKHNRGCYYWCNGSARDVKTGL